MIISCVNHICKQMPGAVNLLIVRSSQSLQFVYFRIDRREQYLWINLPVYAFQVQDLFHNLLYRRRLRCGRGRNFNRKWNPIGRRFSQGLYFRFTHRVIAHLQAGHIKGMC